MIEIKENEAFILANCTDPEELKNEKKAHKKSMMLSRVEAIRRLREARA